MFKLFAITALSISMNLATLSAVAAPAEPNTPTTTYVISSQEYIDKDDYSDEQFFKGVRVNTLESGNISFNYCYYERIDEVNLNKDCSLPLGSQEGYPELIAKEKLFNYDKERGHELLTSAVLTAGVIIVGVIRLKMIKAEQIKRFKSGQSFFSGLGDMYLYGSNLPAIQSRHIQFYAWLLGGVFAGKIWHLDDAGEQEERIKELYDEDSQTLLVEDFNPEKLANKLSRAL